MCAFTCPGYWNGSAPADGAEVYPRCNACARINSLQEMIILVATSMLSLFVGALGERLPYAVCMTIYGGRRGSCADTVFR